MEPIVTGLYWRKSAWNGFATVPVILRLDGDILILKTSKDTVWQAPISETRCRFTVFGTMIVTFAGKEYAFVPAGAGVSRSFSKEQLAELNTDSLINSTIADATVRMGTAATTLGPIGAPGAPIATAAYATLVADNISMWSSLFESRHLLDKTDKNANPGKYLLFLLIGGVVIGIGLVILFKVVLRV